MLSTSGLVRPGLVLLDSTLGGDGQSHWFQCLRVLDTGGGSSSVLESRRRGIRTIQKTIEGGRERNGEGTSRSFNVRATKLYLILDMKRCREARPWFVMLGALTGDPGAAACQL